VTDRAVTAVAATAWNCGGLLAPDIPADCLCNWEPLAMRGPDSRRWRRKPSRAIACPVHPVPDGDGDGDARN
jgi:hypothetical protein